MVKSKKMSKTSIAVIVLALLLVLSLVMGITGAWFTDTTKTSTDTTGTFGTVTLQDIGANEYKAQAWQALSNEKVVPGSSVAVTGGNVVYTGNVDAYVKVAFTTTITINGQSYAGNTVVAKANGVAVSEKTLADYITQGAIAIDGTNTTMTSAGTAMYAATVEDSKTTLALNGFTLEFSTDLPNTLELENGTVLEFNDGAYVVSISATFRAVATQMANWATPAAAESFLDGILAAEAVTFDTYAVA